MDKKSMDIKRKNACFFTGHRMMPANRLDRIKRILKLRIKDLIEYKGVDTFIAGGAIGFDMLAAETVLELKTEFPEIKLYLYLPCYNQSSRWTENNQFKWQMIMTKVDDYIYVTEGNYTAECMRKRNLKMADDAENCIAYCVLSKSGTGATLAYAERRGCDIYNIADIIYEDAN